MPLSLSTTTIGVSSAAGVVQRLEGDAAGHRAVADHGDDLAVGSRRRAHRLLDADGVAVEVEAWPAPMMSCSDS